MVKTIIVGLVILVVSSVTTFYFFTGVYNTSSYIRSFEKFVEKVEQKSKLSDLEYADVKKKYIDYTETYFIKYESKLTDQQKNKVTELKSRYYSALVQIGTDEILEDIKDIANKTKEFFKSLFDSPIPENYESI